MLGLSFSSTPGDDLRDDLHGFFVHTSLSPSHHVTVCLRAHDYGHERRLDWAVKTAKRRPPLYPCRADCCFISFGPATLRPWAIPSDRQTSWLGSLNKHPGLGLRKHKVVYNTKRLDDLAVAGYQPPSRALYPLLDTKVLCFVQTNVQCRVILEYNRLINHELQYAAHILRKRRKIKAG